MPQLVSDADVKAILDTTINTQPFIVLAVLLIDQHLSNQGLSTALMRELQRWLAAHFACMRDPRFTQVKTENDSFTYEHGPMGQGLRSTKYGQQVLAMDPTGILAEVTAQKQQASIHFD